MDVFKFNNPTAPTKMEAGVIINDLKSKMWIERYAQAGEFKFVADAKSGIRTELPIGSFVSHVDTSEIMIVENHEISDNVNSNPEIVITGRGFETYFENRIVGSNRIHPSYDGVSEFILAPNYLWIQIATLIQQHIYATNLLDDDDAVPFVSAVVSVSGVGEVLSRSVKRGDLYTRMLELLAIENLGVKVIRPGPWSPLGAGSPNTAVMIHVGVNRTGEIIFSHDTGEIESADYLWSNKKNKNAALIAGRWVETEVTGPETLYNRRTMFVDASDIDNSYSVAPTGADLAAIVYAMRQRGLEALATQNDVALTKAQVSKNNKKAAYRKDFDVGDLISVHGSFNESTIFRVSEYVEIEDNTGSSGYPTLTVI